MALKKSIAWIYPLKVNQRFGGMCRPQLQIRGISQARNQHEAGCKQSNPLGEIWGFHRKQEGTTRQFVSPHWVLLCPGSLICMIFILRRGNVMSILLEISYKFCKIERIK
jgi:hypothetical protein